MGRSKPGTPASSPASSPAKGGGGLSPSPSRPPALSSASRAPSIITPQSPTLHNARVVVPAKEASEDGTAPAQPEVVLRPLSPHDVLCGRGGLVNGYVGNVTYRDMVAERREEYLLARKRDKAEVARAIVRAVLERGGMFLRRADPEGEKGETGDGRSSRWTDIGEARAREKTSQALREGLDVRGKGTTSDSAKKAAAAMAAAAAAAGETTPVYGSPPADVSPKKKRGRPPKSKASPSSSASPAAAAASAPALTTFLPRPVASFLSQSTPAITTPREFADATDKAAGRNELASSLAVWSSSSGVAASFDSWLGGLRTEELWRDQVKVWTGAALALLGQEEEEAQKGQQEEGGEEGEGAPSTPKKKAKKEDKEKEEPPAASPSPRRGTRGRKKEASTTVSV